MEHSTRCAHCGAVIGPGVRFCPECGRSTDARSPGPWPWIAGGLAAALALVLLFMFLLRPKGSSVVSDLPRTPSGPAVVSAPPRPPSGPPIASAPRAPGVPEDPNRAAVAAYLQKMAVIEARRKQMVNNLGPALLTLAMLKNLGGLQDMMQQLVGIVRNETEMLRAKEYLGMMRGRAENVSVTGNREFNPGWHTALDLYNMLTISEAITMAALERKESRGAHFREDYPDKDAASARFNLVIKKDAGGQMTIRQEPIPEIREDLKQIIEEMK